MREFLSFVAGPSRYPWAGREGEQEPHHLHLYAHAHSTNAECPAEPRGGDQMLQQRQPGRQWGIARVCQQLRGQEFINDSCSPRKADYPCE
jgi:hypothetical protein